MFRTLTAACAIGLLAAPVLADGYTYADFEASVPHIDLEECPTALAEGDVFCRVTMNSDALHIYVFESGGDQPFVSVTTFFEDEFTLDFGQ